MAGFADLILSYSPVRTVIGHSTARSTTRPPPNLALS
jgi:hypothetical protein